MLYIACFIFAGMGVESNPRTRRQSWGGGNGRCKNWSTAQLGEVVGNECYQPASGDHTHYCTATASSVLQTADARNYNPDRALTGKLSLGNHGFFHSAMESYPWLKIKFLDLEKNDGTLKPIDVSRVQIFDRCDEPEIFEYAYTVTAYTQDDIDKQLDYCNPHCYSNGRGTLLGIKRIWNLKAGGITTIATPNKLRRIEEPIEDVVAIVIQKTAFYKRGMGVPGQSKSPETFMMVNEVIVY